MAEQSSDPWRTLWRLATSNEVLVILLLALAASLTLRTWIPQRPSADVDYARWLSQTQARFGEATPVMQTLGLFSIMSSFGFRALLALLSGCLFLHLVEGADQLRRDQEVNEPDGEWQKISDRQFAPILDHLMRQRYRLVNASSFFQVDHWPWSGVLPLLAYAGSLLLLLSLLLFHLFGWQVDGLVLQKEERRTLPDGEHWVSLTDDGGGAQHSPGLVAFIEESGPGVEVSAVAADGESLQLLLTSDAEPSTVLRIALTGDTYFAVPEEELIVRLNPRSDEPYARADVQIYSSPTGEIISEQATDKGGQTVLSVGGVTLTFAPAPYGRVTATRNPGRLSAGLGLCMLVVGVVGSLMWPDHRFWLREREALVEGAGCFPSSLRDHE